MYEKIALYKKITEDMILILRSTSDSEEEIAKLLDERQEVLNSLKTTDELIEFREIYRQLKISELDDILKELLTRELNKTKRDILEQKRQRMASSAYRKVNKEGLNLFSTQV